MSGQGCEQQTEWTAEFVAGPAAATPTSAGTLTVTTQVEMATLPAGGACHATVKAATARLTWTPDPSLVPWLPVSQVVVRVDGKEWSRTAYGQAESKLLKKPWDFWGVDPALVAAVCPVPFGTSPPISHPGAPLGVHTIELAVHVAGMATDPPPLLATVELSCTAAASGADALGGADASPVPGTPPAAASEAACSAGGPAGGSWLLAVVGAWLAVRVRRMWRVGT